MELFTGKAGCIRCHHCPLLTDHELHYTGVPEREGDSKAGARYKTASLRDATRRYSFMHNGYFLTIQKVLDHYSRGGTPPEGLTAEIEPLSLSDEERADLLAFLQSLHGRISDAAEDAARDYDVFEVRAPQPARESAPAPPRTTR
jgi:cytochrome c peroxidase